MATFTFLEAAQRLAELEPHVGPTGYFHSQLRDFASRELIEPAGFRGSGRTATTLIDEVSLARGKIFSVLTRIGLKSGQINQVARQLYQAITKNAAGDVDEVWIVKTKGLPRPVVEGIKAGKNWWLVVM